jgi:hypothetical protein
MDAAAASAHAQSASASKVARPSRRHIAQAEEGGRGHATGRDESGVGGAERHNANKERARGTRELHRTRVWIGAGGARIYLTASRSGRICAPRDQDPKKERLPTVTCPSPYTSYTFWPPRGAAVSQVVGPSRGCSGSAAPNRQRGRGNNVPRPAGVARDENPTTAVLCKSSARCAQNIPAAGLSLDHGRRRAGRPPTRNRTQMKMLR